MKLWQCACGKTCGTWELSPTKGICSVCFEKGEAKRLKLVAISNMSKKRTPTKKANMEKLTDYVE